MQKRDQVAKLAKQDPLAALELAESISETRQHIQALGWVARYAPPQLRENIFPSAVQLAEHSVDVYAATMSLAWPLRAAVETAADEGKSRANLAMMIKPALDLAPSVQPTSSRAQALVLLLHAVIPTGIAEANPVIDSLVANCQEDDDWRVIAAFVDAALLVNGFDRQRAVFVANAIKSEKKRRATLNRINAGETMEPRPFFW